MTSDPRAAGRKRSGRLAPTPLRLWVIALVPLALAMTAPVGAEAGDDARSATHGNARQKLTIFKQTARPNALGRPVVYLDCTRGCKGTLTLLTAGRKQVIGSGMFDTSEEAVPYHAVKLNSRGRRLIKKPKVTVLARGRAGRLSASRRITLRRGVSACDLVTPAEVTTVMGEPVDPGQENKSSKWAESATRTCVFEASAKRPSRTPRLSLGLERGYGARSNFEFYPSAFGEENPNTTEVSGVGDRAWFYNGMAEFHAAQGDSWVSLVPPRPPEAAPGLRLDLQPALATAALGRLK